MVASTTGTERVDLNVFAGRTTMRMEASGRAETLGTWDAEAGQIIIRRDQLKSYAAYAGTLLHECTHARSRTEDISSEFEDALTSTVGNVAARALDPPRR